MVSGGARSNKGVDSGVNNPLRDDP